MEEGGTGSLARMAAAVGFGIFGRPVPSAVMNGAIGPSVRVHGRCPTVAGAFVTVIASVARGLHASAVTVAGETTSVPLLNVRVTNNVDAGVVGRTVSVRGQTPSVALHRDVIVRDRVTRGVVGPSVAVRGEAPTVHGTTVTVRTSVARGVAARTVHVTGQCRSVTGTPTVDVSRNVSPGVLTAPVRRPLLASPTFRGHELIHGGRSALDGRRA